MTCVPIIASFSFLFMEIRVIPTSFQIDSNETVIHRQALSMRISKEGKISNFEKIRNKFPISTLIVLSSTYVEHLEQRKIQSACWAMVTRYFCFKNTHTRLGEPWRTRGDPCATANLHALWRRRASTSPLLAFFRVCKSASEKVVHADCGRSTNAIADRSSS